jgi:outer membrane lipoprotein-sorting protein
MFDPGVDQITVLHAGANQAQYESFLTLGFGGSGSDLERAWKIADLGPETIDGVKTEKLDLTAKDAQASSMFTHITIWVDPARAVSLKQVFYAPSGDVRTAYYSNIRLNTKIDKGTFAIKKDSHTTVVNR